MDCLETALSEHGGRTYPESFPRYRSCADGRSRIFPSPGEVIMDAAGVSDVAFSAVRVGDVGCWKGVVVPGASESPPPVVFLPVPFVETSGGVFPFADCLSQD